MVKQLGTEEYQTSNLLPAAAGARPCPTTAGLVPMRVTQWVLPAKHMAKHIMKVAPKKLKELILSDWTSMHQPMLSDKQDIATVADGRKLCHFAGLCVCHKPMLRNFTTLLQAALRKMFAKGSSPRQVLDSGKAVLRFDNGNDELWLHIAYQNLTSWRAFVIPLTSDTDDMRQAQAQSGNRVALVLDKPDLPTLGLSTWWQLPLTLALRCFRNF
jgi:hypothetical protein